MITVVGRWESDIIDPDLEMRMLRQLKGAYGIDRILMVPIMESMTRRSNVEQFPTMEEALSTCTGKFVFLEHKGTTKLSELPTMDNITLITGNADFNNLALATDHITCKINSPHPTVLFAVNAIAIALAYVHGQ